MQVLRPIEARDLESLLELLEDSGHGLTSLPRDPEVLSRRIAKSIQSFQQLDQQKPNGDLFLFVMEDIFWGKIVGVCGIISKIGGFEPCYFYQVKEQQYTSKLLPTSHWLKTLELYKTHSGPSEICSLFLSPKYRNFQNGRLLSLSRFLYIAEFPFLFEEEIIAEMRGVVDDQGHSPFFEAVAAKFLHIPFPEADLLTIKNKEFIEELMPKEPIIVNLLTPAAQEVVQQVHPQTEPALKILLHEGFNHSGLIGIFEAGPVIKAQVSELRAIKNSELKIIADVRSINSEEAPTFIISNRQRINYLCCIGQAVLEGENQIILSDVVASSLRVKRGDSIRLITLK